MKKIIWGAVVIAMWIGIFAYLPTAYLNERCGEIESRFVEKQENPEMYLGMELTADLKKACPSIESNLTPVVSQSSANDDGDIWAWIQNFQTQSQLRALELENDIASQ